MAEYLCHSESTFRRRVLQMDESTPEAHRLAKYVEAFTRSAALNRRTKGTWMFVSGPTGIGKTHAMRLARRFLDHNAVDLWSQGYWPAVPAVVYATWSRVVDLEREEWDEWLYDLRRAKIVFLDDVGSEIDQYKSGRPIERLRLALEASESKFLLCTSNVPSERRSEAWDARVVSRLQRAVCLELPTGVDYRVRAKKC